MTQSSRPVVTLADVEAMDNADLLAHKRAAFVLPTNTVYLDGNSLGALPLSAQARSQQVVSSEWGQSLVSGWNRHDWINLPGRVGDRIARLLSAAPGQTVCCDSTSINLYKVLHCALDMQAGRRIILTQTDNFPADLYIAEGLAASSGAGEIELRTVAADALEQQLDTSVAVLLLTHVHYRTASMHDIAELTRRAHALGVLVVWDLAHSVGAVPLALDAWQVDFAVGCGYKYLNGGPGAPAFVYAAARHHAAIRQPLTGWMGHKAPFEFAASYTPAPGINQFLCGTPAILSMSVLDAALDVFADVDMSALRQKSVALTGLFLALKQCHPGLDELVPESPGNSALRGSHLAFAHPEAYAICQALIARQVICDFRAPHTLRLGFAPLYVRFRDVWQSIVVLAQLLSDRSYRAPQFSRRQQVT